MKKTKTDKWTVMVMSDAQQPVIYFRLPKIVMYSVIFCILLLVATLLYSYRVTHKLQQTADKLQEEKVIVTKDLNKLQEKHKALFQEAVEIQEKIDELKQLEVKMREMSNQLPGASSSIQTEPVPMGGLETEKSDSSLMEQYKDIKDQLPDLIERSEATLSNAEKIKRELELTPTLWPTKTRSITSPFGNRKDPITSRISMHTGIDIAGPLKSPIYATADGKIVLASYHSGYGNSIIIRHSSKYRTRYAHLYQFNVAVGDQVKKGQVIGYMGSTGRSTGVHLHYEVLKHSAPVNPYPYMTYDNN